MDERIEAFLRAVVDLEGNFQAEVREGVRICLADYERKFPDIPRVSYRERVVEEIARQKGTPTEHMHDNSSCYSFSGLQLELHQLGGGGGHVRDLQLLFQDGAHCRGVPIRQVGRAGSRRIW